MPYVVCVLVCVLAGMRVGARAHATPSQPATPLSSSECASLGSALARSRAGMHECVHVTMRFMAREGMRACVQVSTYARICVRVLAFVRACMCLWQTSSSSSPSKSAEPSRPCRAFPHARHATTQTRHSQTCSCTARGAKREHGGTQRTARCRRVACSSQAQARVKGVCVNPTRC